MKVKTLLGEISVFFISFVLRLPSLGWDIFNADAFRWKARSFNFSNAVFSLDFAKTAQTAHPGVVLMWFSTLAIKIYSAFNELFRAGQAPGGRQEIFELHFVQKLVLVIAISFLISLSFHLLRKLTNRWIAFFSVFLLTVEPYFVAHTRIYHLDALLAMLMFVSVLALLVSRPLRSRKSLDLKGLGVNRGRYLMLSGVFAALAFLTKSTALLLVPFVASIVVLRTLLISCYSERSTSAVPQHRLRVTKNPFIAKRFFPQHHSVRGQNDRGYKALGATTLVWLLITAATFVAVWPAMWVQPLKTLQLYFSGIAGEGFSGHGQVVFGQATTNPGWIFYPLSLWIRLSPWMLGLAGLGVFCLVRYIFGHSGPRPQGRGIESPGILSSPDVTSGSSRMTRGNLVPLISCLLIFLYLLFISIPSKKLERYSLPLYPFVSVLAGYGLYRAGRFLEQFLGSGQGNPKSEILNPNDPNSKRFGNLSFEHLNLFRILCFVLRIFNPVVVGMFLAFFFFTTPKIFPDYLAYYSPLAGGLRVGIEAIQPDWALGTSRVGEYLNAKPNANRLRVLVPETDQFRPFVTGYVFDSAGVDDFGTFDYVVLPVWNLKGRFEGVTPAKVIEINSVPIYNVYLTSEFLID